MFCCLVCDVGFVALGLYCVVVLLLCGLYLLYLFVVYYLRWLFEFLSLLLVLLGLGVVLISVCG